MSGLTYLDLDLMFTRGETGYRVQVLRSPAGDGQVAVFDAPFTELELENLTLKVGRFRARTRRVESAPVAAAKDVGSRLYSAVFADEVHECLQRSLDHARNHTAQLRIRLRLSDCPELANLPWEMLYDQGDDWFIALSNTTPIVRYIQLPDSPRALHVTLPLRVLVIRSEPTDYPKLDLEAEWAQVAEALRELTAAGAIDFTELISPTKSDLLRALQRSSYHVLHYMGHGGFDEQNGGALLFADRTGGSVPVTAEDLGVLLRDHTSMRLAVLNACEGARSDPADPFAGVADTLVRRGIPAVIAMQFEFSDDAAIEFAPALYRALAAGQPVDAAVGEARKAVYTVSPLEWATPVLYLRATDAQLFDITQDTPLPSPAGKQQPDPQDHVQESPANVKERRAARGTWWLAQIYASARKAEDSGDWGTAIAKYSRIVQADSAYRDVQIRLEKCERAHVASRPSDQHAVDQMPRRRSAGTEEQPQVKLTRIHAPTVDVRAVAEALHRWYEGQGLEVIGAATPTGQMVQCRTRGSWRRALGMGVALTVALRGEGDYLVVEVGAAKWLGKGLGAGVGLAAHVGWVTVAVGAWKQYQLPKQTITFLRMAATTYLRTTN
jgi:CHAT domain